MITKIKQLILFVGDVGVFYLSLGLTLLIRYGIPNAHLDAHLGPFSIICGIWIILFYSIGLYDIHNLKNSLIFLRQYTIAIFSGTVAAIILFYIVPYFSISPKRTLLLFVGIYILLGLVWRWVFNQIIRAPHRSVTIIGSSDESIELADFIRKNPQTGLFIQGHFAPQDTKAIQEHLATYHPHVLVCDTAFTEQSLLTQTYQELFRGTEVIDTTTAYHTIMKKIPLRELDQMWIMTRASKHKRVYNLIKTFFDFLCACVFGIIALPFCIIIAGIVRCSSRGPIFYTQTRIGKNEKPFTIYKFRTMRVDAEKNGAQWALGATDPRATRVGRLLRFMHLDELPQLLNVLKGEVSLVGPRPERPEFVEKLRADIPYYDLRLLVKPGITGWAQVNHRADLSIEDTRKKLQYDIYYLKERSVVFDVLIILKTIKMFLFNY